MIYILLTVIAIILSGAIGMVMDFGYGIKFKGAYWAVGVFTSLVPILGLINYILLK